MESRKLSVALFRVRVQIVVGSNAVVKSSVNFPLQVKSDIDNLASYINTNIAYGDTVAMAVRDVPIARVALYSNAFTSSCTSDPNYVVTCIPGRGIVQRTAYHTCVPWIYVAVVCLLPDNVVRCVCWCLQLRASSPVLQFARRADVHTCRHLQACRQRVPERRAFVRMVGLRPSFHGFLTWCDAVFCFHVCLSAGRKMHWRTSQWETMTVRARPCPPRSHSLVEQTPLRC